MASFSRSSPPSTTPPRPTRAWRRNRFSLRLLFVTIAVFGALLATYQIGCVLNLPISDSRAAATLNAGLPAHPDRVIVNGEAYLVPRETNPFTSELGLTQSWPTQMRTNAIAWRVTKCVPTTAINLRSVTPVDLSGLGDNLFARFPELKHIAIDGRAITLSEQQITSLLDNTSIETLRLYAIPISESQLQQISRMEKLHCLALRRAGLTDRDASQFRASETLTSLDLSENQIGDLAFANLVGNYPNLESLFIDDCPITNETVKRLVDIPRLKRLSVCGTAIDDNGIASMSQCKKLTLLQIYGTKATYRSISAIDSLQTLEQLTTDSHFIPIAEWSNLEKKRYRIEFTCLRE